MEFIEIEIVNWAKHQRKDVKRPSWFALSNRILEDAKLFDLEDADWKALIYIFCQASQQGSAAVKIFFSHASRVCGIPKKTMQSAISRLCHADVTRTLRESHADVTPQDKQDKTEQTGQDIAPAPPAPVAENPVAVYCESYKARYGHNPVIGGKQSGVLTQFAKNHPRVWPSIIRGYLQMPDSWATARSHPVELLESKLNEIARFLKTGKVVTRKVIDHAEEMIDKAQGTNRRPRKSIQELEAEKESQQTLLAAGDE